MPKRLLPWGIFFWVPFCLALRPLEPPGSVSSFLRAVVFCPFVYYLFFPGHSPLMLLPQLAPMAALISINAGIVLHRNERFFRRLSWVLAGGAAAGLAILSFLYIRAAFGGFEINDPLCTFAPSKWIYLAMALLTLGVAVTTIYAQANTGEAAAVTSAAVALRFLFFALWFPFLCFALGVRQYIAAEIRSQAGEEWKKADVIYLHATDPFPAACYYLQRPVKRVYRLEEELPQTTDDIYLLCYRQPIVSHRTWIPVTDDVNFNLKRQINTSVSIFKGTSRISRTPTADTGLPGANLKLYRGIHRE